MAQCCLNQEGLFDIKPIYIRVQLLTLPVKRTITPYGYFIFYQIVIMGNLENNPEASNTIELPNAEPAHEYEIPTEYPNASGHSNASGPRFASGDQLNASGHDNASGHENAGGNK